MVRFARTLFPDVIPVRFLDPGLGTGVFFSALLRIYHREEIETAVGYEIEQRLAVVSENLWAPHGLQVVRADFTIQDPPPESDKPNLIISNPPYVRHHHIARPEKERLRRSTRAFRRRVSALMGLYGYFMLLSHNWLADRGGAVWIVPAEFLDVNYGTVLKHYLHEEVILLRIHRFDPADVQFQNALVTSAIIAFRKGTPAPDHQIQFTAGCDLLNPSFHRVICGSQLEPASKWSLYFNRNRGTRIADQAFTLGDFFSVKRGIATGNNAFFVLEETEALRLNLPRQFLRPVLPSPRSLAIDRIESDGCGLPVGIPRLFVLDCPLPRSAIRHKFPMLERYLVEGERRGVPHLYLPRSRSPWYSQEKREPPPILCTYMARGKTGGRTFRFIRNCSQAIAYNVYLLLYPKSELELAAQARPEILDEVFTHLQSLTDLERIGRVYGGGLNKLEPGELSSLPFPAELAHRIIELANHVSPRLNLALAFGSPA